MRETDSVRAVEHQDVLVGSEETVVERVTEAQRRKILIKHLSRVRRELELGLVVDGQDGALIVMRLGAELDPALVIAEIDSFVLWRVDVGGPKESDIAMIEDMLVGFAPKSHVDVVGSDQL